MKPFSSIVLGEILVFIATYTFFSFGVIVFILDNLKFFSVLFELNDLEFTASSLPGDYETVKEILPQAKVFNSLVRSRFRVVARGD